MKESCVYFTFSSNFTKYIQKNAGGFKFFAIFHIVFQFIQILIASLLLLYIIQIFNYFSSTMFDNGQWIHVKTVFLEQCQHQQGKYLCIVSRDYNQFLYYTYLFAAQLFPTILVCFIDLNITVYLRKISDPDYKTLTPRTYNHFKSKFPHRDEILFFLLTIIAKLSYFIDIYLVMRMYRLYDWTSHHNLEQDQIYFSETSKKSVAFLYLITIIVIVRFLFRSLKSVRAIQKISYLNPYSERVEFLTAYLLNTQHQNNYIWENLLLYFCPQSGVMIFGAYFNHTQISAMTQALLFELPSILIIINYQFLMQDFLKNQLQVRAFQLSDIWVMVSLAKRIVSFLVNFVRGLTIIHPRIKEQEFNSALFLRRFAQEKKIAKMHYKTERHEEERQNVVTSYQTQRLMSLRGNQKKQIHFSPLEQKYEFKSNEIKSENMINKSDDISIIFDEEDFVDVEASVSNIKVQKSRFAPKQSHFQKNQQADQF